MKKFYTFEPKNFRIFSKMKSFLAVALLLLMAVGTVNAQSAAKLVTDLSTLGNGDQIVIVAASGDNYYALGTVQNTNNRKSETIEHAGDSVILNSNVQLITLKAGSAANTFKMHVEGEGGQPTGFLYAVSGSNYLRTKADVNDNEGLWYFSMDNDNVDIKAKVSSTEDRYLRKNSSNALFSCYTSGQVKVFVYKVVVPEVVCEEYITRTDNVSLCESKNGNTNQYYDFYGKNLNISDAGTHFDTVPGVGGACDTIVTLNLSVIDYYYEIEHQMYEGDIWEWHGTTITDSGWVYTEYTPAETACGCDSFVYAHVTFIPVNSTFELVDEACVGSTYTFPLFDGRDTNIICTETYYIVEETKAGVAVGGHDSTRVLYLDVYPTYNETATDAICQGTEYQFGEGVQGYHFDTDAEPGVYTNLVYTFQSVHGCDSTVTLTLTINPVYNDTVEATFCENQLPQNVGEIVIEAGATTGVYTYPLHTVENCDSTVTVLLTVNPIYTEDITETICASRLPYDFRGHEWTEAGSETYNETTIEGCDSIVNFTLVVNPVYNDTLYDTICPSELATYEFRGHTFTEGGVYPYNETSVNDCDSIVVFNLTVIPVFNREELDTTICVNEAPFVYYGQNCETTGTYVVPVNTCGDTTATLRLTVNETNACTFTVTIEAGENGTITGATTVNHGEDYDYEITPNTCYYIESITLDGADQTIDNKDGMTLTLDSVYTDHTIAATFAKYSYNVTAVGTVEASDVFECGETVTYTFVAEAGYHIDSLYVDDVLETAAADETWTNGSKEFTMTADHSIEVFYSKSHYTVSASATGIGGTISPVGDSVYVFDAFPTYTFTSEECIGARRVLVDGEEVTTDGESYTFDTLTHNTTIEVVFDTVIYDLTSVFHGYGLGTVNGQPEGVFGTAACASTVSNINVDADAATHSRIDSVRWNGLLYNAVDAPEYQQHMELMPVVMNGTNNILDVYFNREYHHVYAQVTEGNGTVSPTDSIVYYTDAAVVTATADHGWHVATITCGDETWTNVNGNADSIVEFTVASVISDTNVYVTFEINNYTITINTFGDGTTTPAGPDSITQYGNDFELTATPGSCTYLDSIVVDDETVTTVNLTNIESDHVINVYFTVKEFTMTGSGEHATVEGTGTVLCGSDYVYTITADSLYHVDSVQVNGVLAEVYTVEQAQVTHTVTNVTEASVLTAYTSLNHYAVTTTAEHGTVTPATASVEHGGNQTFAVVPDDCYHVSGITVNGNEYDMSQLSDPTGSTIELVNEDFSASLFDGGTDRCNASGTKVNSYSNWTLDYVYKSEGKVKLGSSSSKGYIEIPVDLTNCTYDISFDAKAWYNDATTMNVVVDGETTVISGLNNADDCVMSTYHVTGSNGSANSVIRFEGKQATKARFYIDNIVITKTVTQQTFTVSDITEPTEVVISFEMDSFNMAYTANGEGTVNGVIAGDSAVVCGSDFNYELAANEGYHVESYTLDGVTTPVDNSASYVTSQTVEVSDVHADHSLTADFAINTYNVTAVIEHQAGSYDPATPQVVNHGGSATITFTADATQGYHIEKIVCGEDIVVLDSNSNVTYAYTVNEVVSDTNVYVYFKHNEFPITVIFDENAGDITPLTQNWEYGETVSFQITPNDCKYIDTILVDNTPVTIDNVEGTTYTFDAVVAEHTIEAIFADSMFTMTGTAMNEYGTINSGEAVCGGNFVYNIVANEGYHVNWVMVDGENVPEYTDLYVDSLDIEFTDIHAEHVLRANFEIDYYDINIVAEGAGTVTPSGNMEDVVYNTPIDFTFAPEACQELVSFMINDEEFIDSVENNAYTWHAVAFGTNSIEVVATFDTIVYTMAETHIGEGTVANGEVNCGEDYTYNITAGEGYHIESYTIGGNTTTLGANTDITADVEVLAASSDTTLDVVFEINTYNVVVCDGITNGTVVPGVTPINHGDTCFVTVTADAAHGYHIETITCGDDVLELIDNDSITYVYAINNVVTDTTICATFELNRYVVNATADDYCTIVPEGDTNVRYGDTVVYTIQPVDDCHYISTVVIDDVDSVINDSVAFTYAFNDIQANHTIVANSAIYTYIATTSVNDDNFGEITPTDTLDCGETFNYEVTPIAGYHIDSVLVDGEAQTIEDSSAFTGAIENIHADVAIDAYFSINHYTIVSVSGDNGTISPEDTIVYEYGETPAYTITPDPCYYISEVLVDDQPVEITDSTGMTYTFEALEAAHTIVANFAIYQYAMTAEYDDWMGNVTTEEAQDCGTDYQYIITANTGYHIVSYTIGGVETTNTMDEPNDFVTDTITISPVSQDTNLVVVFDTNTYTVSVCAGIEGGTVVVNEPVEVNYNEGTTVTVTADSANGYHIATITDDRGGNDVELGENTNTIYTYSVDNVTEDIVVCATFELNTFKITATAGENGTITPEGDTIVTYGDIIDFVIEPNHTCYYISDVVVDGESVWVDYTDSVSAYTYTFNVSEFDPAEVEHTISAEYTIFEYTMASNAYTEGTVSSATVNCGTDYDYEIEANYGYHIDHVVLDGVTTAYEGQETTATITVTDVQSDHQLDVYFTINHYTVTATAGEHGSIEVAGVTTVAHGEELTYTITPDHCYYISEVLVNDEAVEFTTGDSTSGTYTFASVEDTMTIHADFHIYEYAMTASYDETMGTVEEGIADCGSNFTYNVHANEGYHIVSIQVGSMIHNHYGLNEDTEATFNVYNVSQDTVCYVEFAANTYTVDFNVTGEGTVDPESATVTYDSTLAYTATAAEGYHIVSVTDNGTEVYTNDDRDVTTYEGTIDNIRENHTVEVVFAINEYTITATAGAEGQIVMPGENTVNYGQNINFTIRATEPCYYISNILVDGEVDTTFTNNETLYTYTFNNVDADHTIEAQFDIRTYTVTVTSTENGTVDPSDEVDTLNCGENATYTFTPDEGYEVVSVTVNGQNMGAQTSYTISNIQNDYTIDVVFGQVTYTLTSSTFGHGTIEPMGDTTVAAGATVAYTLTPDDCYTVSNILVNGVSYLNNDAFDGTTLTIEDVQSDMTVQAYFQIMKYTVTTEAAEGGVITETALYNCGTDVVIAITPDACYNIDSVVVDGVDQGEVTEVTFDAIDADHTVNAYFSMKTYVITASVNDEEAGTITETDTFNCGEAPTYEITANEGYHIVSVEVDGQDQGAIESYTFASLHEDHTIVANFEINTYTLTVNANTGVEIDPVAGDTTVEYGASVTYTFTVDSCYEIADVMLDGESIGAVETYTFSDVDADHVLMVSTTVKTYTITATTNEGGSITPAGETSVTCNGTQGYNITAAAGYYVEDVLVDGSSVGVVNNYVFSGVTEDHTIEVVFAANDSLTYTITASAGDNGTITPEGDTTVLHGASVTYRFTPDEHYTVDQVIVDGNVLPTPVATYTFSNVTADHTIQVTFVADQAGCVAPNITYTTNITETSATFNWNDTEAASYTIRYKKLSDTTYTIVDNITDVTYDVTGLEEATEYVWSVKAVCVADEAESSWSVSVTFVTEESIDTTDIHNIDMSVIRVYSYGNDIYVTNESNEQIKDVQVYDMNGRMIHRGLAQNNPEVINVNAANGIYIVRVVTETMVRNYKVSITQR